MTSHHHEATTPRDIDREPTPQAHVIDLEDGTRLATLHKGAIYTMREGQYPPMEGRESVRELMGLNADLMAEIHLGEEYQLFLFDRGVGRQGVEEPVIPGSKFMLSDRYFLADAGLLLRANIRHKLKKDMSRTTGLLELCSGASVTLGRGYDNDGRFETEKMPDSVSRKHASVSIDFDGRVYIGDNNSVNLTTVLHKI